MRQHCPSLWMQWTIEFMDAMDYCGKSIEELRKAAVVEVKGVKYTILGTNEIPTLD